MGVVRQCACGRGVPRPYGWVYVRLKTGRVLAAMMCRGPDISGPYRLGVVCGHCGTGVAAQCAAGRIARKGALQSGPYG